MGNFINMSYIVSSLQNTKDSLDSGAIVQGGEWADPLPENRRIRYIEY